MSEKLKLEDFPHLVDMKKKIESIQFGEIEYWKQRCLNREKMDDPTYSEFERDNCYLFHRILVHKER